MRSREGGGYVEAGGEERGVFEGQSGRLRTEKARQMRARQVGSARWRTPFGLLALRRLGLGSLLPMRSAVRSRRQVRPPLGMPVFPQCRQILPVCKGRAPWNTNAPVFETRQSGGAETVI